MTTKPIPDDPVPMAEAIRLARVHMDAGDGGPFGAVVVRDGAVIGRGWNRVTSAHDPTAHAEIVAIREACRALKTFSLAGCVLYASCEPCPMCLAAMYWARLDGYAYAATREDAAAAGFDDAWIYEQVARPLRERDLPAAAMLREDALEVFRAWETKKDRVPY